MSLYDDLGLAADATPEAIKAAYRAAAKRDHPDCGGDLERFDRIQRAYDVLGDAERRARYDETGQFDDSPAMAEEQEAVTLLRQFISNVLFSDADLTRVDLVGAALAAAKAARDQMAGKTAEIETNLTRLAIARTRLCWASPDGPDLLARILDHQEQELRANLPRVARAVRVHDRAMKLLKGYIYRVDVEGGSMSFIHGEDGLSVRIARTPRTAEAGAQ